MGKKPLLLFLVVCLLLSACALSDNPFPVVGSPIVRKQPGILQTVGIGKGGTKTPVPTATPTSPINSGGSPTPTPTQPIMPATPTPTPAPAVFYGFSFEATSGIEGWNCSEQNFKKVSLATASFHYQRDSSLEVISQLGGSSQNIYLHTEVKVNMYEIAPEGYHNSPPYNWSSQTVSAEVWFSPSYVGATVDLYVVTITGSNWYNDRSPVTLTSANTGKWLKISFSVGSGYLDSGFDQTAIGAIGVRVDVPVNFPKTTDPFYVDAVTVPAPG